MSKRCYARLLGDCEGKLSREHLFSSSTLEETVKFLGTKKLPPKEISRGSAVAKILCQKHNSMLSPYDMEAKQFVEALSFVTYAHRIGVLEAHRGRLRVDNLKGELIERWFLKTAINMAYALGGNHELIAGRVLDYLFRGKKFEFPHGLHHVDSLEWHEGADAKTIACAPLLMESDGDLGGFAFFVKGYPFSFWFPWLEEDRILKARIASDVDIVQKLVGADSHWHCSRIDIHVDFPEGEVCMQNINFVYEDA